MNIFKIIKYRYLEWKWDRVLKQSGCSDWRSYFLVNDYDYDQKGKTVRERFIGYPYIIKLPYESMKYSFHSFFGPTIDVTTIDTWCRENCRGKYRYFVQETLDGQGLPFFEDCYFGFQREEDCILFSLTCI